MRVNTSLEKARILIGPYGSEPNTPWGGAFIVPGPCGTDLKIIASSGDPDSGVDWEHVSVSCKQRCPNWLEMCFVKSLFWDEEENRNAVASSEIEMD